MSRRCDIHVHSKHSDRPSEWYLERIGSPESFTEPLEIHRLAKARGMDFVTVSDHDSIAGALALAHLPDTFLSSEETVTFPEDGAELHVLVLGVTETQHGELQRRKRNLYDFRDYARAEGIVHVVAHPLFRVNDRLTVDHVEKLLVLFRLFEGTNGTRDRRATALFDAVLTGVRPATLAALADRHALPLPDDVDDPRFATTGGSDDHGGLYVATTWTETPDAATPAEFLAHFAAHPSGGAPRCRRGGEAGSSLKLARSFQLLAHDYYRAKVLGGSRWRNDPFADLLRRIAGGELDPDRPEGNAWDRTFRKFLAFAPPAAVLRPSGALPALGHSPQVESALAREDERRTFESSCRLGQLTAARVLERVATELEAGDLLRALPALSDLTPAAVAISPYIAAFRFQHKDEPLHRAVADRFATARALRDKSDRVAWATDTLADVNGVARTVSTVATIAARRSLPLTVLCAEPVRRSPGFAVESFTPIWETPIPRYEELTLRVPPALDLVEHCEREGFGRILISTPGPVGLAALAAGRLLGLPTAGIYHTDFPRYVHALSGGSRLENLARSYVRWFYRQMDEVYVSGDYYRRELEGLGIDRDRMRDLPRGVDLELFRPERHDERYFARWFGEGPPQITAPPVVLYVGRVSREKNLAALFEAFGALLDRGVTAKLAIVGDGPDRAALELRHRSERIAFTGCLEGEELAGAYASADLFVFPSRTDTFGNVVLEAMASGLAPIVASEGGPAEQVRHGENGLVVDLDRPGALADAIALALADPPLRERMGRAARSAAESRSWNRFLDALFPGAKASAAEERFAPARSAAF